ncbi:MAG: nuclear transport factor 2 family protein [Solirubrobacterales bacterium]
MSESQIETLKRLNAAFNGGGDWAEFYDAEAELHMPPEWLDESVYRGRDGLRQALRQWREGFDEYHWDEERLIDAADCVVGLYHHRGRIKGADTWIDQPIGCIWRFRGERIIRLDGYFSWAAAIEAAGLSEPEVGGGE